MVVKTCQADRGLAMTPFRTLVWLQSARGYFENVNEPGLTEPLVHNYMTSVFESATEEASY